MLMSDADRKNKGIPLVACHTHRKVVVLLHDSNSFDAFVGELAEKVFLYTSEFIVISK